MKPFRGGDKLCMPWEICFDNFFCNILGLFGVGKQKGNRLICDILTITINSRPKVQKAPIWKHRRKQNLGENLCAGVKNAALGMERLCVLEFSTLQSFKKYANTVLKKSTVQLH